MTKIVPEQILLLSCNPKLTCPPGSRAGGTGVGMVHKEKEIEDEYSNFWHEKVQ